ncbi:MAG: hypothetical protein LBU73_00705 [Helicobacteraceae bacterium]|jgi:hypothetical protein|nr:hypothetical protein [Helicobacteraceae bacterium]
MEKPMKIVLGAVVLSAISLTVAAYWRPLEHPPRAGSGASDGVVSVTDDRASAEGVLRFHRDIGTGKPHDGHRLDCFKKLGVCFDFVAAYDNPEKLGSGYIKPEVFVYKITTWNEETIAAFYDDGLCVKAAGWFLDLKTKNVYYRKSADETAQNNGRCDEDREEALLMKWTEADYYDRGEECDEKLYKIYIYKYYGERGERVCLWEKNYLISHSAQR